MPGQRSIFFDTPSSAIYLMDASGIPSSRITDNNGCNKNWQFSNRRFQGYEIINSIRKIDWKLLFSIISSESCCPQFRYNFCYFIGDSRLVDRDGLWNNRTNLWFHRAPRYNTPDIIRWQKIDGRDWYNSGRCLGLGVVLPAFTPFCALLKPARFLSVGRVIMRLIIAVAKLNTDGDAFCEE